MSWGRGFQDQIPKHDRERYKDQMVLISTSSIGNLYSSWNPKQPDFLWLEINCMMNQTFTWEMVVSPKIHLKVGV